MHCYLPCCKESRCIPEAGAHRHEKDDPPQRFHRRTDLLVDHPSAYLRSIVTPSMSCIPSASGSHSRTNPTLSDQNHLYFRMSDTPAPAIPSVCICADLLQPCDNRQYMCTSLCTLKNFCSSTQLLPHTGIILLAHVCMCADVVNAILVSSFRFIRSLTSKRFYQSSTVILVYLK